MRAAVATTLLGLGALLQVGHARTLSDHVVGFHVSSDPVDMVGDRYHVSVRHCEAMIQAVEVLRERHGWRIALETPVVTEASEWGVVISDAGDIRGYCPRVVEFGVSYSSADPLAALQAVVAAYNATDPPFTAAADWCGDVICVRPVALRNASGTYDPVAPRLDLLLDSTATTRDELLDEILLTLQGTTTIPVKRQRPRMIESYLAEPYTPPAGPTSIADHLVAMLAQRTDELFHKAYTGQIIEENREANRSTLATIHGQLVGQAHRDGMSEADFDAWWGELRPRLEEQLPKPDLSVVVEQTPGLGPGGSYLLTVQYDEDGAKDLYLLYRQAIEPRLTRRFEPLGATVPTPGPDADGDGIADVVDQCPDSPAGELVQWNGCTVAQSCPCEGTWANNGAYNACVREAVSTLVSDGTLSNNEKGQYQKQVKLPGCGQ